MQAADFGVNQAFVEELLERWRRDPLSVDREWRGYFDKLKDQQLEHALLQDRVRRLVDAYRARGHLLADLDPLDLAPRRDEGELALSRFDLADEHRNRTFTLDDFGGAATLDAIVMRLQETYCRSIGAEFMHIEDAEARDWLRARMEANHNRLALTRAEKLDLLAKLTDAELFEQFIHAKFLGAKRFSLEGAESLIPLVDRIIHEAAGHEQYPVTEIVLGMAHRGRLNVLANTLGKPLVEIFAEFEDIDPQGNVGRGDVKYHMGHSADVYTQGGRKVHVSLAFNPSHLEWVYPVVLGRVRAKQQRAGDADHRRGMPLLLHGDAAFAGQGLIAETLNLYALEGYRVGGTVHVIVNNQVGFTTFPEDGRSTRYATDVCRMLAAPIFHVNGEDPEAVAWVARLAVAF